MCSREVQYITTRNKVAIPYTMNSGLVATVQFNQNTKRKLAILH